MRRHGRHGDVLSSPYLAFECFLLITDRLLLIMTENDVNPPINNDPMEKRNKFIELPSYILSRQRTTKALIRLGRSAALLFAYGINRFSHDVALIIFSILCVRQLPTDQWTMCPMSPGLL